MTNATRGWQAPPLDEYPAAEAGGAPPARALPLTLEELAGEDPQMLRNIRCAHRIADTNVSVLIQGPTGSGKEAFAHAMHLASRRAGRPFIAVNCAAIPETLSRASSSDTSPARSLERGAKGCAAGSYSPRRGTLFLDEIGDMPLALQSRLLRVLEEREVVPLGSESAIAVDLHVLAASHRNLRGDDRARRIPRGSLLPLNGITLELPALRERTDKERLIEQALAAETGNGRPAAIERDALQSLLAYSWPGNIRELRNVIRTALAICEGGVVRAMDLPREIRDGESLHDERIGQIPGASRRRCRSPATASVEDSEPSCNRLQAAERAALLRAMEELHGNMSRVAAELGVSRNTLYRKIKRHGIAPVRRT